MICSAYDLKEFYRDFKGRVIRGIICDKILTLWPDGDITNNTSGGSNEYIISYIRYFVVEGFDMAALRWFS